MKGSKKEGRKERKKERKEERKRQGRKEMKQERRKERKKERKLFITHKPDIFKGITYFISQKMARVSVHRSLFVLTEFNTMPALNCTALYVKKLSIW
jgi:hypothetical protein